MHGVGTAELSLVDIFRVFIRRWKLALFVVLLGMVISGLYAYHRSQYQVVSQRLQPASFMGIGSRSSNSNSNSNSNSSGSMLTLVPLFYQNSGVFIKSVLSPILESHNSGISAKSVENSAGSSVNQVLLSMTVKKIPADSLDLAKKAFSAVLSDLFESQKGLLDQQKNVWHRELILNNKQSQRISRLVTQLSPGGKAVDGDGSGFSQVSHHTVEGVSVKQYRDPFAVGMSLGVLSSGVNSPIALERGTVKIEQALKSLQSAHFIGAPFMRSPRIGSLFLVLLGFLLSLVAACVVVTIAEIMQAARKG